MYLVTCNFCCKFCSSCWWSVCFSKQVYKDWWQFCFLESTKIESKERLTFTRCRLYPAYMSLFLKYFSFVFIDLLSVKSFGKNKTTQHIKAWLVPLHCRIFNSSIPQSVISKKEIMEWEVIHLFSLALTVGSYR